MRIATYEHDGATRAGIVEGAAVRPLPDGAGMVMVEAGPDAKVWDAWYQAPAFYFSNPNALFATGDDIQVPPRCRLFDFELEVAAIIGTPGRDLTPENAREHIAGYT